LVHALLVAPHYFVGSFDDDSGYILSARALLSGGGLGAHIAGSGVVVGLYPPGYSALLVPLQWIWPHTFTPLRLLSLGCFCAVFVLTWVYLARRAVGPGVRIAVLTLMALGPPFATYATMVMAEAPYLVVLLLLLLALDSWERQERLATLAGVATVVSAAALIWLKQAGIGAVLGVFLWLVLRGRTGRLRALLVAGGTVLSLVPVIAVRAASGIPIAGSRYSEELGGFYQGGLLSRLVHVVPHSTWQLLSTAIPTTLLPFLQPLPIGGHWPDLFKALSWTTTILVTAGAVQWWRHHRDAAIAIVPVYLAECVLWPYVNERRAILVLPILASWYVLGAVGLWTAAVAWIDGRKRARREVPRWARPAGAALLGVMVVAPLVAQAPRDYLFGWAQNGSHFQGSPYVKMLSELGQPRDVVETDYLYSTSLFTGHDTAWTAFLVTQSGCDPSSVAAAIARDNAAYLFLGDVNKPHVLDRPCLLDLAQAGNWAVPLLHTSSDNAYVFELVGPGTGNPGLTALIPSATQAKLYGASTVTAQWTWSQPRLVSQVSLDGASVGPGTDSVRLEALTSGSRWLTVASSRGEVGEGPGGTAYLLANTSILGPLRAIRVVVGTTGSPGPLSLSNVAAFGPSPGSGT
jgi:hypothetical protein